VRDVSVLLLDLRTDDGPHVQTESAFLGATVSNLKQATTNVPTATSFPENIKQNIMTFKFFFGALFVHWFR
jgi:hypothetical protein